MSDSPWAVSFERRADKDVERLDKKLRQRVINAVERLAEDPDASTGLRKLKGRAEHRLRVGEWRVLLALNTHRAPREGSAGGAEAGPCRCDHVALLVSRSLAGGFRHSQCG